MADVRTQNPYAAVESAFLSSTTREATDGLTPEQRALLLSYWMDRADGELTTALCFEYMLDDLRKLGAPSALLDLAESAIVDEHQHVDWCLRWAARLGRKDVRANFAGTRPLEFEGASAHDNRLLRTIFGSCFSETLALHALLASQRKITVESVRRLNHQHIKEELRHARLGWALLAWPDLGERDRHMIASHVPAMEQLLRQAWQSKRRPSDPVLHQLGFLSSEIIDGACEQALDEVIRPGLELRGAYRG